MIMVQCIIYEGDERQEPSPCRSTSVHIQELTGSVSGSTA